MKALVGEELASAAKNGPKQFEAKASNAQCDDLFGWFCKGLRFRGCLTLVDVRANIQAVTQQKLSLACTLWLFLWSTCLFAEQCTHAVDSWASSNDKRPALSVCQCFFIPKLQQPHVEHAALLKPAWNVFSSWAVPDQLELGAFLQGLKLTYDKASKELKIIGSYSVSN